MRLHICFTIGYKVIVDSHYDVYRKTFYCVHSYYPPHTVIIFVIIVIIDMVYIIISIHILFVALSVQLLTTGI